VNKAALIAWREIRWEIYGDRAAVIRTLFFAALPVLFVLSERNSLPSTRSDLTMIALAFQSALFPALSGVALIASTFTQEKENGTLLPLLAAPVRDMDIVVGKLLGMIGPVMAISAASLAIFYVLGRLVYGPERIERSLPPEILYAILIVAFLYLVTAGSWALIIAARVRTTRAAQQLVGLLIGLSVGVYIGFGFVAARVGTGWPLLALGPFLLALDVIALEIARRVWQRGEVIGRL